MPTETSSPKKRRESIALAEYIEAEGRFETSDAKRLREQSLRASIKDGAFWSSMEGFGTSFVSAFAVALKATSTEIGLLASFPQLVSSITQLPAASLTELWGERKKIISFGVFIQALTWLPILLIPLLFPQNPVAMLLIFITIYFVAGTLASPAWQSLIGDLVPAENRGKFFGHRNKVIRIVAFACTLAAGAILSQFPQKAPEVFFGFAIIFGIALASRLASWHYLGRMHEPAPIKRRERSHDFLDFFEHLTTTNFGTFVLFSALFTFAMQIASPYFALLMLRELSFSYVSFTIVTASGILGAIVSYNLWGKMQDRFGNKKILTFTTFLVCLTPALWLINQSVAFLTIIEFIAGFYGAGFNQALANFVFDSTIPEVRHKQVAFYNAINGIALFLGAMTGAGLLFLFPHNSSAWLSGIFLIFAISSILRLAVTFLVLPRVKEERKVEPISERELMAKIASISTLKGIFNESLSDMRHGLVLGARDIQGLERLAMSISKAKAKTSPSPGKRNK